MMWINHFSSASQWKLQRTKFEFKSTSSELMVCPGLAIVTDLIPFLAGPLYILRVTGSYF